MKTIQIFVCMFLFFAYTLSAQEVSVNAFEINALNHNTSILNQSSNTAKLGNACGPMALMAIYNHYAVQSTGTKVSFLKDKTSMEAAVGRLYEYLRSSSGLYHRGFRVGVSYVDGKKYPVTAIWDNSFIAETRDNWNFTAQFQGTTNLTTAVNAVETQLSYNRPVIVLTNGLYSIPHFVVVYSIDQSGNKIKFFDPWNGNLRTYSLSTFKSQWKSPAGIYNYMAVYK